MEKRATPIHYRQVFARDKKELQEINFNDKTLISTFSLSLGHQKEVYKKIYLGDMRWDHTKKFTEKFV